MSEGAIEVVRILGVLGVLGSFTIMVTDWIGWTRPLSSAGKRHDMSTVDHWFRGFPEDRGHGISHLRRYWASVIGGLAMLPCGLGFVTIYLGLIPAGHGWALLTAGCLGGIMVFGTFAHTMCGIVDDLSDTREETAVGSAERARVDAFYAKLLAYMAAFMPGLVVLQVLGSMLFSYFVFTGQTVFPAWVGLINHFILSQLCMATKRFAPLSVWRWIAPPHMHLLTSLPLLIAGSYYTWNGVALY
ncbi:MAG: DUF6796 family protein [Pseudomonadota bacterium]